MSDSKACTKCHEVKPLDEFYQLSKTKLISWCRGCRSEYSKMFRRAQPLKEKDWRLRSVWGFGLEDFNKMFVAQGGNCPICLKPLDASKCVVDHCHDTKKIRSLLHRGCNMMLGMAHDDPSVLRRAAEYIELHKASKLSLQSLGTDSQVRKDETGAGNKVIQ